MKNLFKNFSKWMPVLAFCFVLGLTSSTLAATTPSLGEAATYGVVAGTYLNDSVSNTIKGDVGFTTAPAATPGPLGLHPSGTYPNYGDTANDTPQARIDIANALSVDLAPQTCSSGNIPGTNLSTDTSHGAIGVYGPGVYCTDGAVTAANITLSGAGTYIFRIAGALDTTAGDSITLTNGASACDVFWTPTAATTLGANTNFIGNVIANATAINIGSVVVWTGRALNLGAGSVGTLGSVDYIITAPTCSVPSTTGTIHIIKVVNNAGGGTAVPSDFTITVNTSTGVFIGSGVGTGGVGTSYTLNSGAYAIIELANASYTPSYSGDCLNFTISGGNNKTCTITNTYIPPVVYGVGGSSYFGIVPLIGITKVPNPLALPAGSGAVTYNYTVWDISTGLSLVDVTVTDNMCTPITFLTGDTNHNNKLDIGEKWKYSCTTTLLATTTNTAITRGFGDNISRQLAVANAIATVVVGVHQAPPVINIVKIPSRLTPFPFGGGDVVYTYNVSNPGIVPMSDIIVTDDKCSPLALITGDANRDHLLDTTETWTYTCNMYIGASTRNVATAQGTANGFIALGYAFANVYVNAPILPATGFVDNASSTLPAAAGILIAVSTSVLLILKKRKSGNRKSGNRRSKVE